MPADNSRPRPSQGKRTETGGPKLDNYQLEDRYLRESGRVFLTGTQALVRILLTQAALDRKLGLKAASLVSGYRGLSWKPVLNINWRLCKLLPERILSTAACLTSQTHVLE